uniref:ATP synthase F0 subunit 8 n=1 Tax=Potamon fluviatile TaxID=511340 RepID=UPI00226CD67B|nr:ATP synthase F0 subunit 8 [Potamon fluviatile]UZH44825.1 ATP synthase subunit 8 [Potamon fluviatile]
MPQMAPLFWLSLLFFFILTLMLFLVLNYFIKPFKTFSISSISYYFPKPSWKL